MPFYPVYPRSGFDSRSRQAVSRQLSKLDAIPCPVADRPRAWGDTTWVEPRLWCEVRCASIASTGTLREPVFLRLRPDIDAQHVSTGTLVTDHNDT